MTAWGSFVEVFESGFFVLTQALGGNLAWGIIAFSLGVRMALLPLTYWVARRAQVNQVKLAALRPELEKIQKRFRQNPPRLMTETTKLYAKHDYRPLDGGSFLGTLIQLPVFIGMFSALRRVLDGDVSGRFLWISNLSRPDIGLALLVAAMTYFVALIDPQGSASAQRFIIMLPVIMSLVMLSRLSAGYGLYWGASTIVGGVQAVLLRRSAPDRLRSATR